MARSAFTGALAVSAFLLSAAAMTKAASVDQAPNGVPSRLLNQLNRGVNITRWFCYSDAHDTARFKGYLVDEDFQPAAPFCNPSCRHWCGHGGR